MWLHNTSSDKLRTFGIKVSWSTDTQSPVKLWNCLIWYLWGCFGSGYRMLLQAFLFKYYISFFINLYYHIATCYRLKYTIVRLCQFNISRSLQSSIRNQPPPPPSTRPQVLTFDELILSLPLSLVCLTIHFLRLTSYWLYWFTQLHVLLQCCFTVTDIKLHAETLPGLAQKI